MLDILGRDFPTLIVAIALNLYDHTDPHRNMELHKYGTRKIGYSKISSECPILMIPIMVFLSVSQNICWIQNIFESKTFSVPTFFRPKLSTPRHI